ncbi:hypothetical protein [Embleya sp. NPDC050493]|uniref:hypothetical protein n=1 Tax=Embleya sp. NPDC050493 TaxID=3363989 RepID=UPI003797629A
MRAGGGIETTTNPDSLPVRLLAGLGVAAGWAVAALPAGGLLLRKRDTRGNRVA